MDDDEQLRLDVERQTDLFDYLLEAILRVSNGTADVPIFSVAIEEYMIRIPSDMYFIDILNCNSYYRYFGNFCNMMVLYVFRPEFMLKTLRQTCITVKPLSNFQIHDAIRVLYKYIVQDRTLDYTSEDYYGETPLVSLRQMIPSLSPQLRTHVKAFEVMLKHGPGMTRIHTDMVYIWARRRRARLLAKQRKAVAKIEEWWFDMITDPDHYLGQRFIKKMSLTWNKS